MKTLIFAVALCSFTAFAQSNPPLPVQGTWQFQIGYQGTLTPWQGSVEIRTVDSITFVGVLMAGQGGFVEPAIAGRVGAGFGNPGSLLLNLRWEPTLSGPNTATLYTGTISADGKSLQATNGAYGVLMLGTLTQPLQAPGQPPTTGCSTSTLSGSYGYSLSGWTLTTAGSRLAIAHQALFSDVGKMIFDGSGHVTGIDTVSSGGTITAGRQYSGNYTVNQDCIGTLSLSSVPPLAFDLVITSRGQAIELIESDQGAAVTGTAQQQ